MEHSMVSGQLNLMDGSGRLAQRLALAKQHGGLDGRRAGRCLYQELIGGANLDAYLALVAQIEASMKILALPEDIATSMVAAMEEYNPTLPPRERALAAADDRLVLSTYRLAYYHASSAEWDRMRG